MRRSIAVVACLTVLIISGASTALAGGHHGGPGRGHGPHHSRYGGGYGWNNNFRGPVCGPPVFAPRPRVVGYPVYPAYPVAPAPVAPAYPRLGLGLGGSNFSFWYQQ